MFFSTTMVNWKRLCKFWMVITAMLFIFLSPPAMADAPKRVLKNNMTEVYNDVPGDAESVREMFSKGMYYGRLRLNSFYWEWEDGDKHDPTALGLGGSFIYKTAKYYGVSATAGLYTSQNMGLLKKDDALFGKSGKDTFSRYDKMQDGDWGMTVLAQAYLQYNIFKSEIKIGRQIFESFLTKSNDTKMIPNTFEGITLISKGIPDSVVTLGFLTQQKLRDHTEFHDVITFNDGKGKTYSKWNNQDDSAVHKGLSYANLKAGGEDVENDLVVAGITNKSLPNLKLDLWYTGVPDLFFSVMGEANYNIDLGNGWSLTPGIRYMQQYDRGAGDVGGAALNGSLAGVTSGPAKGYHDPDSVDGGLYAGRLVLKKGAGSLLAGYSKVLDDADLITPWRGFPTGGYTRSMAQYNWEADTETCMVKAFYDFGKAGMIKGFRAGIDFNYINYDDKKEQLGGFSKTDRFFVHTDMWYKPPFFPDLEAKVRIGMADDQKTAGGADSSYSEFRFELNYLF